MPVLAEALLPVFVPPPPGLPPFPLVTAEPVIDEDKPAPPPPNPPATPAPPVVADDSVPLPSGIPEIDDSLPIEREFRALIQELLDAGVDPADMMTDPRLEDITERALAQEFETWPVFMQMVS